MFLTFQVGQDLHANLPLLAQTANSTLMVLQEAAMSMLALTTGVPIHNNESDKCDLEINPGKSILKTVTANLGIQLITRRLKRKNHVPNSVKKVHVLSSC